MKNTISFENHVALGWTIAYELGLDVESIKKKIKGDKHTIIKQCAFVCVSPKNITMDAAASGSPHGWTHTA
jgi:hypothetical protein